VQRRGGILKRESPMSLQISNDVEARLIDEARKHGISVNELLERFISEHVEIVPVADSIPELPVMHLGAMGPLHRRDIYDYDDVP
jgi:hypothetical protein